MEKNIKLEIGGMHCAGCSGRVEKRLTALGCKNISVSLENGTAEFTAPDGVSAEAFCEAIEAMGFTAKEAQ